MSRYYENLSIFRENVIIHENNLSSFSSLSLSSILRAGVGMRLKVSCAPVCQSDRGVIRGIKGIEGGLSLRARIHNEIKAPGAPQWSPHGQLGTNMLPLL